MTSPEAAELEAVDAALAGRPVPSEHAQLAELVLLLRDDRPEATASWAAGLDRRVQAGFPARPRRRARVRAWFTPGVLGPVAACSFLVLLIGVSVAIGLSGGGSSGDDDAASGGGASVTAAQEEAASGAGSQLDSAQSDDSAGRAGSDDDSGAGVSGQSVEPSPPPASGDPGSDSRSNRKQERSANMTLAARPREIDRVAADIGRVAANLGGFVAESAISSTRGGHVELRVPSARLDTAVQRLSDLADVRELTRQSRDITSSVVSAREALNDARTERKSLLRQLAEATTVNETESIRARLQIVSREIAAARARLRSVNNRAQFANVGVNLVADRTRDDDEGAWTPGDALDDAGRVLEVVAGVAVITLAVALPVLLLWGLGWLAHRGLTRRRRERALDMA
jgi:uncharacterized protein DUF4349